MSWFFLAPPPSEKNVSSTNMICHSRWNFFHLEVKSIFSDKFSSFLFSRSDYKKSSENNLNQEKAIWSILWTLSINILRWNSSLREASLKLKFRLWVLKHTAVDESADRGAARPGPVARLLVHDALPAHKPHRLA